MDLTAGEHRLLRALLVLGVIAVGLWLAGIFIGIVLLVADVLLLFLLAWLLSYLLAPVVRPLEARLHLPKILAVALVYVALFVVLGIALAVVVPRVAEQVAAFAQSAPLYGEQMTEQVRGLQRELDARGVALDIAALYGSLPERVAALVAERSADLVAILGGVLAVVVQLTLVLILSFFMLVDGQKLWRDFVALLPSQYTNEAELFRLSADRSFGGFLRGQLLLGLLYGTLTTAFFAVIGLPFATLLGVVSGLLMVIPFFGAFFALIPPLVVALPQGAQPTLVTLIGLVILQNIVLNLIAPRLLAQAVGIHPLFVFLALLIGARLAGFWGVFLALPIAGMVNVFFRYFYELAYGRRRASRTGAPTPAAAATILEEQ